MESWSEWTDPNFFDSDFNQTFDLSSLKVDQAYVYAKNNLFQTCYLYWKTIDCVKCPFKKLAEIPGKIFVPSEVEAGECDCPCATTTTTTCPPPPAEQPVYEVPAPSVTTIPVYVARNFELRLAVEDFGHYIVNEDYLSRTISETKLLDNLENMGPFGVYNLTIGEQVFPPGLKPPLTAPVVSIIPQIYWSAVKNPVNANACK